VRKNIAFLAAVLLAPSIAWAAPLPNPFAADDPETLLDLTVGDAEVSVFAKGFWAAGIAPAFGWVVSRDPSGSLRATGGFGFPGLGRESFANRIDMTLSLWLLERYFFEAAIAQTIATSTILFGYAGREGESVQSVFLGNTGIGIGSYPYLGFAADIPGSSSAPGATAAFQTPWSEHEVMIRFAPAAEAEIIYSGGGVVTEQRLPAHVYDAGHFVLPDGGLDFVTVYLESSGATLTGSDSRQYRLVDLHRETSFSLSDGTVSFHAPPATRVVVYYEAGGKPIGDDSLGTGAFFGLRPDGTPDPTDRRDFAFATIDPEYLELFGDGAPPDGLEADDLVVTIGGARGLLIHQPGRYAPFALASVYRDEAGSGTISLEDPRGAPLTTRLRITRSETRGIVTLHGTEADPRAYENRYPLASSLIDAPVPGIYGRAPRAVPSAPELVVRTVSAGGDIVLPAGFVPGSVRITRNGTTEHGFTVTADRRVVFDRPLSATDVIRIRYRTSASADAGDLQVAIGNRFRLGTNAVGVIALGGQWNPPLQEYSTRPGQHPGRVTLSASLSSGTIDLTGSRSPSPEGDVTRREAHGEVRGALSISSPDTSGALRLAGMDGGSRSIPVVPTGLFAAPPPQSFAVPLTRGDRGRLFYRDYYEPALMDGRTLLSYDRAPAPPRFPYADGGRTGPYPVLAADAAYAGAAAVLEYEIGPSDRWVAGLIRIDGGRGVDLSDARTLIVPYRVLEASGAQELFVQIGAIGEDLDGDGTLDRGTGGLPFHDESAGVTLMTGTIPPAGMHYTEDARGTGVLDAELPDLVLSRRIDDMSAGGDWRFAEIRVTAAEALRLRESRAVRLLITSGGGEVSGRVLVGEVRVLGSSFSVRHPRDTGFDPEVHVRERAESDYPGERLSDAFPEVASRFSTPGVAPRVLSVLWSGLGPESITLTRAADVPGSDYATMRLYYRAVASAAGVSLTLRARDGPTMIAERTVAVGDSDGWREIVVPLPVATAAFVTAVDVVVSGRDSGELLLDELSFRDPRGSIGAVATFAMTLVEAATVSIGDTTVLSDLVLTQRLTAQSTSFPGDIGSARAGVESSTDLSARVLGATTRIGLDLAAGRPGAGHQVRHELSAPIAPLSLIVHDRFRAAYGSIGSDVFHDAKISFDTARFDFDAGWSRRSVETNRLEWHTTTGFARPAPDAGSVTIASTAGARLAEVTTREPASGAYPLAWIESYRGVVPVDTPRTREGSALFRGSIESAVSGIEVTATGGFRVDDASLRRTVDIGIGLVVPVRLSLGEMKLRITRSASLVDSGAPAPSPADDVQRSAALLVAHPIPFVLGPFVELADPDYQSRSAALTAGLLEARYRPAVEVELRRAIRSSRWSLVIPAAAKLTIARPVTRSGDAVSSVYDLQADAMAVAPNLFGRLSAYPLFAFYDTDEFQTSMRATCRGGDGAAWESRVTVDQSVRVAWADGRGIRLENVVTVAIPAGPDTSVTSRLSWKRPGTTALVDSLRLLPETFDRTAHLETTLEIDYDGGTAPALVGRAEHSYTLAFGARGSIRVHGGLGAGSRRVETERELLIGLRGGIEGRLRL
jgi:hypothetical protein